MREVDHLNKIRELINRGLHIDGSSLRAKDAIGNTPNSVLRTTMAMIVGYMEGIDATNEVAIEVSAPAPLPMYTGEKDTKNE